MFSRRVHKYCHDQWRCSGPDAMVDPFEVTLSCLVLESTSSTGAQSPNGAGTHNDPDDDDDVRRMTGSIRYRMRAVTHRVRWVLGRLSAQYVPVYLAPCNINDALLVSLRFGQQPHISYACIYSGSSAPLGVQAAMANGPSAIGYVCLSPILMGLGILEIYCNILASTVTAERTVANSTVGIVDPHPIAFRLWACLPRSSTVTHTNTVLVSLHEYT